MMIGKAMLQAWQYSLANPGITKRSLARQVKGNGELTAGYRVVDKAHRAGLLEFDTEPNGGRYVRAVMIHDLAPDTARALATCYSRLRLEIPHTLVDRLQEEARKTA